MNHDEHKERWAEHRKRWSRDYGLNGTQCPYCNEYGKRIDRNYLMCTDCVDRMSQDEEDND